MHLAHKPRPDDKIFLRLAALYDHSSAIDINKTVSSYGLLSYRRDGSRSVRSTDIEYLNNNNEIILEVQD